MSGLAEDEARTRLDYNRDKSGDRYNFRVVRTIRTTTEEILEW